MTGAPLSAAVDRLVVELAQLRDLIDQEALQAGDRNYLESSLEILQREAATLQRYIITILRHER
jgi:RNA polymerase-interacting CarD/CdnL/TRCF family regulator